MSHRGPPPPRGPGVVAGRWSLCGVAAWLLLAVAGSLLLGPGGHPPASALLLPALALPSILFRIGVGLGASGLANGSMLLAAPLEWGVLAAALGLSIRGRGRARRLGWGTLALYLSSFLVPPLVLRVPEVARRIAAIEGSPARGPALETLARSGRPADLPLLFSALENSGGIYRQMVAAACGVTRWGGPEAWRVWATTPDGAAALPVVVWVAVDVLGHPATCQSPPLELSATADEVRLALVHQVLASLFGPSDAGSLYRGIQLLRAQVPPSERGAYLPAMVAGLADPFSLVRAESLRVLLEAREGREIPEPVPWQELGESDPDEASEAEIEACRERWSRWLAERGGR